MNKFTFLKKSSFFLVVPLASSFSFAQVNTIVTGGNALGSGGTVAYSIGQVVYITNTGNSGTVTQGLQHPYEIQTILGFENNQISLNIKAYPNPTIDYLTLNVGNIDLSGLYFQLYNGNGKLIENRKMSSVSETILMENLSSAIYFLKVVNNNNEVKTFKIIKY